MQHQEEIDRLVETLEDVVCQALTVSHRKTEGTLNSWALSAYADGLRLLEEYKKVENSVGIRASSGCEMEGTCKSAPR